ncbi:MAG: hypothetical protein AB7N80_09920 [Bdellovibrionales bacterium]
MNKSVVFLILLFCFASPALAVTTTIQIQLQAHHGTSVQHRITITSEAIRLNGIAISSHILPLLQAELLALTHPEQDTGQGCGSGLYFHLVRRGLTTRSAAGCLGSKTAQTLVDSVRKIEGYSYLRRLPAAK